MKLRINTEILPLICAGLYGTELGSFFEDVDEEYVDDFKQAIVSFGINKINEILQYEGAKEFKDCKASNGELWSPRFYNYQNDRIDFDLEIPDELVTRVKESNSLYDNKIFFAYLERYFGSHDGFISFYPCTKEKFIEAINGKDIEKAMAMYIMWIIDDSTLEYYQKDFEDDVIEEGNCNGWYVDVE